MILSCQPTRIFFFFFFNDTATTEIYTLSLHDALPIWCRVATRIGPCHQQSPSRADIHPRTCAPSATRRLSRSEEHTSELQSRLHLVCRLLLEKKKRTKGERPNNQQPASPVSGSSTPRV